MIKAKNMPDNACKHQKCLITSKMPENIKEAITIKDQPYIAIPKTLIRQYDPENWLKGTL